MNDDENRNEADLSMLLTNASDLMGKQSVRATFKLSAEFIEVVSIISSQLGIKQKSLFDHLMEDMETLRTIAGQMESDKREKKDRVQKTFVISKKSLTSLDTVSRRSAAARDDIVEYSIRRLFPILVTERQKQEKREAALTAVSDHFHRTENLLDRVEQLVGKEDAVYQALEAVLSTCRNARDTIEDVVVKGRRIAEFPLERLQA